MTRFALKYVTFVAACSLLRPFLFFGRVFQRRFGVGRWRWGFGIRPQVGHLVLVFVLVHMLIVHEPRVASGVASSGKLSKDASLYVFARGWLNGWMGGWKDGWMGGWVGTWVDRCSYSLFALLLHLVIREPAWHQVACPADTAPNRVSFDSAT